MKQIARIVGLLYMISGFVLMFSPETGRQMVHIRAGALRSLADWTEDYAQLSHGALRLLGFSIFAIGTMLLSVTTKANVQARVDRGASAIGRAA